MLNYVTWPMHSKVSETKSKKYKSIWYESNVIYVVFFVKLSVDYRKTMQLWSALLRGEGQDKCQMVFGYIL